MSSKLYTTTITTLSVLLLALSFGARAQSGGLSAAVWVGAGADGRLEALGQEVSGVPLMAGAELIYCLDIYSGVSGQLALGGMYVRRQGRVQDERFAAKAWRFTVAPEFGYRVNDKWRLRAGVEIRSAADVAAFDARLEDNVRAHARLGADYQLSEALAVTTSFTRLLGASDDIDNLIDPGRSLRVGLIHRFGETVEDAL